MSQFYPSSSSNMMSIDTVSQSQIVSTTAANDVPAIIKKRRGRQPRQSLLSNNLRLAISRFTAAVGAPVLQPAGFRDFNGWLHTISQPTYKQAWLSLCHTFVAESRKISSKSIAVLKKDVIHEIITNVVKRKSHESVKLVSTNARRQSSIPPSGNTVMTIFESYLVSIGGSTPVSSSTSPSVSSSASTQLLNHESQFSGSYKQVNSNNHNKHHIHGYNHDEKYHHSSSASTNSPYGQYSSSHSNQLSRQASYHSNYSSSNMAGAANNRPYSHSTSTSFHQSTSHSHPHSTHSHHSNNTNHQNHHRHHRNISIASLSSSKSSHSSTSTRATLGGNTTMDISALLIDDTNFGESSSKKTSNYSSSYSTKSKLPSLSQLDEQLRERSEKERRN